MKKTSKYRLFLSSCFLLWAFVLQGQSINPPLLLPPSNNIVFNNYNELMNGATQQSRISFNIQCCGGLLSGGTLAANWKVTVRANTNSYINQSDINQVIPLHHTKIQFTPSVTDPNMEPVNQNPIQISNVETTLISGRPALQSGVLIKMNLNYEYNFIVDGGNDFLKPDGNYYTNLVFTLYDKNDAFIDSYTLSNLGFQISTGNLLEYSTIALQNGSDNIQFMFDSPSDYLNGITVSKPEGLEVVSTQPHLVFVKTNTAQLTSTNTSNTIPVSKFQIQATLNQSTTGITTEPPTPLSPNETLLLTNNRDPGILIIPIAETYEYDLEYSLPAGSADQGLGPPATYSTQVYFIVIPQ